MDTNPPACCLVAPSFSSSRAATRPSSQVDLWATAVLYAVLWGTKTFVVAPPTAANLELMRRWQMNGEAADDETFPADLEGARVVAVGRGQVWNHRGTHTSHPTPHTPTSPRLLVRRSSCPRAGSMRSTRLKTRRC